MLRSSLWFVFIVLVLDFSIAEDPSAFFDWKVSYISASLLGVKQQVFPGAWTAILVYLDNVGIWNLRAENLDTGFLVQKVYVSVVNPEPNNKTEIPLPDNAIFCGALATLQNQQSHKFKFSEASSFAELSQTILFGLFITWLGVLIHL